MGVGWFPLILPGSSSLVFSPFPVKYAPAQMRKGGFCVMGDKEMCGGDQVLFFK